jgi:hypothetical protein
MPLGHVHIPSNSFIESWNCPPQYPRSPHYGSSAVKPWGIDPPPRQQRLDWGGYPRDDSIAARIRICFGGAGCRRWSRRRR